MLITQQPDALNLSGNLKKFYISSSPHVPIAAQLFIASDLIVDEIFYPDQDGFIEIDFKDIIDGLLQLQLPVGDVFEQPNGAIIFTAKFKDVTTQTHTFTVVKGGSEGLVNASEFLLANFLTWQPQTKNSSYHQPEFLSYYARVNAVVKLKAYYPGSDQIINLANLTADKLYILNLNYGFVRSKLSAAPLYYDVWVENASGDRLSFIQRYVYQAKKGEIETTFVFENSIGGIDTIVLTGEIEETNSATISSALFDEVQREYGIKPKRGYKVNSGFFRSEREAAWSKELVNSTQKYILMDGSLIAVWSDNPEYTKKKGELSYFEIEVVLSKNSKYLNLQRSNDPLPELTIETETGEVFFLAPRLNELPWAGSNDVLLPVQFPYEDKFRKISLLEILNGIGPFVEVDPTVPPWVKSISLQDIERWDAGGSTSPPDLSNYYTKQQSDLNFHPRENQRLSTSDGVRFKGALIDDYFSLPNSELLPEEMDPSRYYMRIREAVVGGTPVHVIANFGDLLNVDDSMRQNDWIVYWDASYGKYMLKAMSGGPGPDVYSKSEINAFFGGASPITGYNKGNWDAAYSWGNHAAAGYAFSNGSNASGNWPINANSADNWNLYASGEAAGSAIIMTSMGGADKWHYRTLANFKSDLGLPSSGGYDLQSVTDRGYNTSNPITFGNSDFVLKYDYTSGREGLTIYRNQVGEFFIKNNGNIGFGTSNPLQKFVVSNGGALGFEVYDDSPNNRFGLQVYNRATAQYGNLELDAANISLRLLGGNLEIFSVGDTVTVPFRTNIDIIRSYLYVNNSGNIGFLNSIGQWKLKVEENGWATATSFVADSWFRSTGVSGWFNATYGGGIYMADSTYVRVYNGKTLYAENALFNQKMTAKHVEATTALRVPKVELDAADMVPGEYYLIIREL